MTETIYKLLTQYGPWGLTTLALVALVYKDRQLTALYGKVIEMVEKQVTVNEGTKGLLEGFKHILQTLVSK